MLGAYLAYTLTRAFCRRRSASGARSSLAALVVGLIGASFEILLLRRIYRAPELFQLLATFGVVAGGAGRWRSSSGGRRICSAPRAPGLARRGRDPGQAHPVLRSVPDRARADRARRCSGCCLHRTRWGVLVRAATQDRDMVAALGVNQKWLFTGVFFARRRSRGPRRRAADAARGRPTIDGPARHRRGLRRRRDRRPRHRSTGAFVAAVLFRRRSTPSASSILPKISLVARVPPHGGRAGRSGPAACSAKEGAARIAGARGERAAGSRSPRRAA